MKYAALAMALCVPIAACHAPALENGAASAEGKSAAEAVKAVETELQAAYKAKDAAKIAAFYAADADVTVPFQTPVKGADQEKSLAASLADPAFALVFTNARAEAAPAGDMAYTRGTYTISYTNPGDKQVVTQSGNYVTVFRKTAEGGWKIVQDIASPGPSAN